MSETSGVVIVVAAGRVVVAVVAVAALGRVVPAVEVGMSAVVFWLGSRGGG